MGWEARVVRRVMGQEARAPFGAGCDRALARAVGDVRRFGVSRAFWGWERVQQVGSPEEIQVKTSQQISEALACACAMLYAVFTC